MLKFTENMLPNLGKRLANFDQLEKLDKLDEYDKFEKFKCRKM